MDCWTETYRSFVNTWECDENEHLNIQFYLKRFDEATRIAAMTLDNSSTQLALPTTRHVRFHEELRAGALVKITSAIVNDGPFAGWLAHRLEEPNSGTLSATALDAPDRQTGLTRVKCELACDALPRGLSAGEIEPLFPRSIIEGGGLISNRSIVLPAECDAAGLMIQQFYVTRFTDAAPHAWATLGIDEPWLSERNLGRAAVEMKLTHHQPAKAGDILFLYSLAEITGRKIMKLRHELVRQIDEVHIASGEVLALILDLETRRSAELPADIRRP